MLADGAEGGRFLLLLVEQQRGGGGALEARVAHQCVLLQQIQVRQVVTRGRLAHALT